MELSTEIMGGALTVVGSVFGAVKIAAARYLKLERELRDNHERERSDCRQDYADLAKRVREIEDRAHQEMRTDQKAMLSTLELNAKAFSVLAARLPTDPTPAGGTKR